ncbi:MAG: histidinol dehydrogenase, partial [Duncaniella sp.]|nr:histidinol dehydrogenase [Duncaniella sp.]
VATLPGVRCLQRPVAIDRVGLYIPGGQAPLFSTVLMLACPAKIAGCREVILCTPQSGDRPIAPEILYAASVCGIDRIYRVGGAQAIAAMALGTETIGRVDKIFGPGNRYVTKAKQKLSSVVAIDMPAGPSEVLVMADSSADATFVAADLLSQAEHGRDSQAILVCDSEETARKVDAEVSRLMTCLSRTESVEGSLSHSRLIVFTDKDDMMDFVNAYAPEHLIISMRDAWALASKVRAAGSVFIGNYSPESAGDYASGTNHTLPTAAWARSYSGVNLDSFMRKITYQELTREGLGLLAPTIVAMAEAEGLDAHALAVKVRIAEGQKS